MGLFGAKQQAGADVAAPDAIPIPDFIAQSIPDAGEHFLNWCGRDRLPPALEDRLAQAVDGLRGPNGYIPWSYANRVKPFEPKSGPFTYLSAMTAFDRAVLGSWASVGVKRSVGRRMETVACQILEQHGHAAAATWVASERGEGAAFVGILAGSLRGGWDEGLSRVTNGQFAKSLKHWS